MTTADHIVTEEDAKTRICPLMCGAPCQGSRCMAWRVVQTEFREVEEVSGFCRYLQGNDAWPLIDTR